MGRAAQAVNESLPIDVEVSEVQLHVAPSNLERGGTG